MRHKIELKFLEHMQTLQQKLNTITFVFPSHVHRVVGRQNLGDVAAGFSSLLKRDDFMSEYTPISVKENNQNCQTFLKSISDHNVARRG